MTPVLLILLFVFLVDLFVLLGWSHDSRDGRDWRPRGAPSPDRSAVGLAYNRTPPPRTRCRWSLPHR
jgi:hypothetical protein